MMGLVDYASDGSEQEPSDEEQVSGGDWVQEAWCLQRGLAGANNLSHGAHVQVPGGLLRPRKTPKTATLWRQSLRGTGGLLLVR